MKAYTNNKEERTEKQTTVYVIDSEGFLVPVEIELSSRES